MTHNVDIVWQDPPPDGRKNNGRSKYARVLLSLQEHPGRWALINKNTSPGSVSGLKHRMRHSESYADISPDDYEIVSRSAGGRNVDIYARFVGERP